MFYLGIHQAAWLSETTVPLFISRRRLASRKRFPRSNGRWALDSGGFTEIKMHGKWSIGPEQYVSDVRRISEGVGMMDWAAIQDWMCEPPMLAKTGLTIRQHQELTIKSYLDLTRLAPDVTWVPVLQGWRQDDYLDHVTQYATAGVALAALDTVGLGSVCRRQGTEEFANIVRALAALGLKLHGFGVKTQGLMKVADLLKSSDSLAWSSVARWMQRPGLPQCEGGGHKNCANCLPFGLEWRSKLVSKLPPRWGAGIP